MKELIENMKKYKRIDIESIFEGNKEHIISLGKILLEIGYNPKKNYTKEKLEKFKLTIIFRNLQLPYERRACFPVSDDFELMQEKIFFFLV